MIESSVFTDRLNQLRLGSLYAPVDLFDEKVQLRVKFSVEGIESDKWELFGNKKYTTIEEERASLIEDVSSFFTKKLSLIHPGQVIRLDEIC